MTASWPVDWPTDAEPTDEKQKVLAEEYAVSVLRMLTLFRVGGDVITVIPRSTRCNHLGTNLLPVLYPSAYALKCLCTFGCGCSATNGVELEAPVGRIDEVRVDGVLIPASDYHMEDNTLVREGGRWPSCHNRMTVTYLNGYPVDIIGSHVAGLLAHEFLKALQGSRDCRLPDGIKTITRGGVSIEFNEEMFAGGLTGIVEVDTWLMQWNPYGLRTRPQVYSIDRPRQRQIWGR